MRGNMEDLIGRLELLTKMETKTFYTRGNKVKNNQGQGQRGRGGKTHAKNKKVKNMNKN